MRQNSGFTLLDTLAACAVLAIVIGASSLALPRVLSSGKSVQAAARELEEVLNHYAAVAALEQIPVTAVCNNDRRAIEFSTAAQMPPAAASRLRSFRLPERIACSIRAGSASRRGKTLTLYSEQSATPGSITLRHEDGSLCKLTQALRGARSLSCQSS